jgi:hypothetical protein
MKKIKPILSGRTGQFAFEKDGVHWSIVDLCVPPTKMTPDLDWEELTGFYRPYNFEAFDGKDTYRFKSLDEAFNSIMDKSIYQ